MLNTKSSKPFYAQIRDYLLHQIHSEILKPHSKIPSERSLSEQFGVSRLTVNKALKELANDGLLYTQVGKGTFVAEPRIDQKLDALTSFSEEMEQRGQRPTSRVLVKKHVTADNMLSDRLKIAPGIPITMLRRVRLANDIPVALETAYLISSVCEGLLEGHDFGKESLYDVLRNQYGLHLTYADQEIEARLPTREEAATLTISLETPLLSLSRVTYLGDDRPIEYVTSAYRGDKYKFRARLMHI